MGVWEFFVLILLAATALGVRAIYDRLGIAMAQRVQHEKTVLGVLENIERQLGAMRDDTQRLPWRIKEAQDAKGLGEVLGEALRGEKDTTEGP